MKQMFEIHPNGHRWRCTDDGEIDEMGLDVEGHNGPICIDCGYSFCMHCDAIPQEKCPNSHRIILI